jgi:hypothetical protein
MAGQVSVRDQIPAMHHIEKLLWLFSNSYHSRMSLAVVHQLCCLLSSVLPSSNPTEVGVVKQ